MKKKFLSMALATAMALSMSTVSFAADNESYLALTGKATSASSNVTLTVAEYEGILIATVPIELPIVVSSDGTVTCPTDAKIINNTSDKTIQVTNVSCVITNGYHMNSYDDGDFKILSSKNVGISLLGRDVTYGDNIIIGALTAAIYAGGELPLNMEAKVSSAVLKDSLDTTNIGTVTFTIEIVE